VFLSAARMHHKVENRKKKKKKGKIRRYEVVERERNE
jgi:hypothetical protein